MEKLEGKNSDLTNGESRHTTLERARGGKPRAKMKADHPKRWEPGPGCQKDRRAIDSEWVLRTWHSSTDPAKLLLCGVAQSPHRHARSQIKEDSSSNPFFITIQQSSGWTTISPLSPHSKPASSRTCTEPSTPSPAKEYRTESPGLRGPVGGHTGGDASSVWIPQQGR